jgi:DNA-binding GntR family transcriptional regulator
MDTQTTPLVLRKSIKDEVYDFLHERILAGEYAPGAWLRQEEVANRLGVSMTPVREALDLLVSSGLAERVPYRGVRILSPSRPDVLNAYSLRLLLECAAVRAAALNISESQLSELHRMLEQSRVLVRLEDMHQERALSRRLHGAIVAAAGNALLHKIYLTVLNTFPDWMLYTHLFRQPELLGQSMRAEYREHRLIVEALAAHEPEVAVQRTVEHVTNRGRELETYLGIPARALRAREAEFIPLVTRSRMPDRQEQKELP